MIKKFYLFVYFLLDFLSSTILAGEPKSRGKYKNWETFVYNDSKGKVCFAQTIPTERSPKNLKRDEFKIICNF